MFPYDVADVSEVNLIEDPLSIDICNLFNGCYELLIQMLGRLLLHTAESEDQLTILSDITVGLMMDVIGPLGRGLTTLPAGPSHPGLRAGPSFRFSRDIQTPTPPGCRLGGVRRAVKRAVRVLWDYPSLGENILTSGSGPAVPWSCTPSSWRNPESPVRARSFLKSGIAFSQPLGQNLEHPDPNLGLALQLS